MYSRKKNKDARDKQPGVVKLLSFLQKQPDTKGCVLQLTCQHRISMWKPQGQKHWEVSSSPRNKKPEDWHKAAGREREREAETAHNEGCSYAECLQLCPTSGSSSSCEGCSLSSESWRSVGSSSKITHSIEDSSSSSFHALGPLYIVSNLTSVGKQVYVIKSLKVAGKPKLFTLL